MLKKVWRTCYIAGTPRHTFYLFNFNACAGGYRVVSASFDEEELAGGGVIGVMTVGRELQTLIVIDIVIDLDIGGVPDILLAAHLLGKVFYDLPVIILNKFIAVSPEVEEDRAVRNLAGKEVIAELLEASVFMMTGGVETEPICRKGEAICSFGRSGVGDAAALEGVDYVVVIGAVGVSHSANCAAEHFLKVMTVCDDLVCGQGQVDLIEEGVGQSVDCHLVRSAGIGLDRFAFSQSAVIFLGGIYCAFFGEKSGIYIKCTADTLLIEDIHKTNIGVDTVVIAKGEGFCKSAGITHKR